MAFNLRYEKQHDTDIKLKITTDNIATVIMDDLGPVSVQLASDEESEQLIKEWEDESGDLMSADNSIFSKYEELRQFRP